MKPTSPLGFHARRAIVQDVWRETDALVHRRRINTGCPPNARAHLPELKIHGAGRSPPSFQELNEECPICDREPRRVAPSPLALAPGDNPFGLPAPPCLAERSPPNACNGACGSRQGESNHHESPAHYSRTRSGGVQAYRGLWRGALGDARGGCLGRSHAPRRQGRSSFPSSRPGPKVSSRHFAFGVPGGAALFPSSFGKRAPRCRARRGSPVRYWRHRGHPRCHRSFRFHSASVRCRTPAEVAAGDVDVVRLSCTAARRDAVGWFMPSPLPFPDRM
jgi:hypothetical protein